MCRKEIDESGMVTRPYGGLEQTELGDIKITEKQDPVDTMKDMFKLKDPQDSLPKVMAPDPNVEVENVDN